MEEKTAPPVPAPQASTPEHKPPAPATPSHRPVMDVKAPPPEDGQDAAAPTPPPQSLPDADEHKDKTPAKPAVKKLSKKPRDGVTTAIVATVIIVLGLAILATYAFVKTQK